MTEHEREEMGYDGNSNIERKMHASVEEREKEGWGYRCR
jgi:hypothetical protein